MDEEVKGIWHIYSDGTRADIPFDTVEDKVYVWNSIAISAESAGVRVLVATVNDTHLHVLVRGDEDSALQFKAALTRRLTKRFDRIYLDRQTVRSDRDAMSRFMYVYRNCLDFYRKMPGEYPWGSGYIYFSELKSRPACTPLRNISLREQYRLFKTKKRLPEEWLVDTDGRILPESFIDYGFVEQMFKTVRAFIAFMYVRREDETALKQEIHRNYLESRSIQDLRRIGNEYCVEACGRTLVKVDLKVRLAIASKMIRNGIAGRTPSLAKALLLRPDDLKLLV